jgi:hypothetical protein
MTASEQPDRSSRLEREVREILERADAEQTPLDNLQGAVRQKRNAARVKMSEARSRPSLPAAANSEVVRIVLAIALAIVAAAIADWSRLLAVLIAIASVFVFFSLWLPSRGPGPFDTPRRRGQDLRDRGPRPSTDRPRFRPPRRPPR